MSSPADAWYVRLPDGRVLRAASTNAVRHHLESGRIPLDSRVRRSADEEWVALDWTEEFAETAQQLAIAPRPAPRPAAESARSSTAGEGPVGVAARLDALQLQTVGVRGSVEELLAALDSTLVKRKLWVAAAGGLLASAVIALAGAATFLVDPAWYAGVVVAAAVALLVVGAFTVGLLSQLTYVELSRLRPASRAEATAGLGHVTVRLTVLYLVVLGSLAVAVGLLRWAPGHLADSAPSPFGAELSGLLAEAARVLALIVEVFAWPVFGLALLLAPITVVEEASVATTLRLWAGMLRQHLTRILLYEALVAVVGFVATLPLTIPVALATRGLPAPEASSPALAITVTVLSGLALSPLLAYVAVANVFIYLNLRYEQAPRRRA